MKKIVKLRQDFTNIWEDKITHHVCKHNEKYSVGEEVVILEYIPEKDLYSGRELYIRVIRTGVTKRGNQLIDFKVIS